MVVDGHEPRPNAPSLRRRARPPEERRIHFGLGARPEHGILRPHQRRHIETPNERRDLGSLESSQRLTDGREVAPVSQLVALSRAPTAPHQARWAPRGTTERVSANFSRPAGRCGKHPREPEAAVPVLALPVTRHESPPFAAANAEKSSGGRALFFCVVRWQTPRARRARETLSRRADARDWTRALAGRSVRAGD